MTILLTLAYIAALIWVSYRIGDRSTGGGIAFFMVGILAYSVVINGPESLWSGDGCYRYSSFAQDC